MEPSESLLQSLVQRVWALERQVERLTAQVRALEGLPPERLPEPSPAARMEGESRPLPPRELPPLPEPVFRTFQHPAPPQPGENESWEAMLGGNWLNKLGVLLLVVGIALALGYSFKYLGPAGIDAICVIGSIAMLGGGVVMEPGERYRTFARGLIGGGWAALYFTVYAMQAFDAARIIHDPWAGALLLLAVSAGIIFHSLRYRSQAVSGVAYFSAFVALAITQVTSLSIFALIPLAGSLLYVARRFTWRGMAVFGLVATYLTCATRPDTGAPLWQVQAIFAVYWLLFEGFDLLSPEPVLAPLNAVGFLSLSLYKWNSAAPNDVWAFVAVMAVVYLADASVRARTGNWHVSAILSAGLTAAAIILKLEHQWIVLALLIEAGLIQAASLRMRERFLQWVAPPLFGLTALHLLASDVIDVALQSWAPVAIFGAILLYGLRSEEIEPKIRLYNSLLATFLVSLVLYHEVTGSMRTVAWGIQGVVLLASGFPLRDRVLRISGLVLFMVCILKLFLWDLRHLDTLPRIFSFIVLGLFLVGVSWVYTRFRERVVQYL